MRFVIQVSRDWEVIISCPPYSGRLWQRRLNRCEDGRGGSFPCAPDNDMPPSTESHYAICAGDADAFWSDYGSIMQRSLTPGTIDRFGRYLFDTLLGQTIWQEMLRTADEVGEDFIELRLSWASSDGSLHRLNWEMMHGTDDFLFRESRKKVAITRAVSRGAQTKVPHINSPPRVLFVIGTSLTDAEIRPAAEYLGLLRQLKRREKSIHSRVLQRASPQRIMDMIESFAPDVVHFICHGGFDAETVGGGYLILESDEIDKKGIDKRRSGAQLLEYLKVKDSPPSIVVLSACHSASTNPIRRQISDSQVAPTMLGGHELAPLAAELVAGGIPIVIGMAGQISDSACRLFTRRFGEALVLGEPLVQATSEGRRAAFREGAAPQSSADWAFPAVFLAEDVDSDYTPLQTGEVDVSHLIEDWLRQYVIKTSKPRPVFCGRDEFLEEYYDLFKPQKFSVLAAYVANSEKGYGRTRLLQHLTAVSLRDGHLPLLLFSSTDTDNPAWQPPQNMAQLCVEILKAMRTACRALRLAPPVKSRLLMVLKSKKTQSEIQRIENTYGEDPDICFDQLIECFAQFEDTVTANSVKQALERDLSTLIADARRKYPGIFNEHSRPILLMDEVHRYDKALSPLFYDLLPLFYDVLDESRQSTRNESVPVVLALSFVAPADILIRPIKEKSHSLSWIKFKELEKFDVGEDMLAYEQVLLHPFEKDIYEGVSDKPWAFDYNVPSKIVELHEQRFRRRLKKIPEDFSRDIFFVFAEAAIDDGFLIPADDDIILAREADK